MTNQEYNIIMSYFDNKHMNRAELEKSLDFENLTMVAEVKKDITKLLADNGYGKKDTERAIKMFVYLVEERSGSGEITWDELIERLNKPYFETSDFGIRVQRFSKEAYWEVFFNHVNISGNDRNITFDNDYYEDTENEKAWDTLEYYRIYDGDDSVLPVEKILLKIGEKWSDLSEDAREKVISAIATFTTTPYVNNSRITISKELVDKITMTNADLLLNVGLRDYTITYKNGEQVFLRFSEEN